MPKTPQVAIGYAHPAEVSAFFVTSLLSMIYKSSVSIGPVLSVYSGPKVDSARNEIMKQWLTRSDAEYLLMLDTDMVFPANTADVLLSHKKDIVGGLAFAVGITGNLRPNIHTIVEQEDGSPNLTVMYDYPVDSLIQVAGTGAACLMIHRPVAEAVWEVRGKDHPAPWFAFGMFKEMEIGEDIAFCLTAGKCGFETWVDTSLAIGHVKPKIYSEEEYVRSLQSPQHQYYNGRETVPIYREYVGGNSSLDSD